MGKRKRSTFIKVTKRKKEKRKESKNLKESGWSPNWYGIGKIYLINSSTDRFVTLNQSKQNYKTAVKDKQISQAFSDESLSGGSIPRYVKKDGIIKNANSNIFYYFC